MKAAIYDGGDGVHVREVKTPEPGPGEVLLRVDANTICGTDLRIAGGLKSVTPPVVLGHELAGTVVASRAATSDLAEGTRVGMTPSISCGSCPPCLAGQFNLCLAVRILGHDVDGGMAEYFLAPAKAVQAGNLVPAPSDLPPEAVALAEPLSCVLHGQEMLGMGVTDVVLVIGGGAIGQLHAQLAKAHGVSTVIVSEPSPSRRELALRLGADIVLDPVNEDMAEVVDEATAGRGADVVVVCTGVPALVDQALKATALRGRVSLFAGFPKTEFAQIDPNLIHYRELTVHGSSNSTPADYARAMTLIASGRVDVTSLVTHRIPLDNVDEALALAANAEAVKVALVPA